MPTHPYNCGLSRSPTAILPPFLRPFVAQCAFLPSRTSRPGVVFLAVLIAILSLRPILFPTFTRFDTKPIKNVFQGRRCHFPSRRPLFLRRPGHAWSASHIIPRASSSLQLSKILSYLIFSRPPRLPL